MQSVHVLQHNSSSRAAFGRLTTRRDARILELPAGHAWNLERDDERGNAALSRPSCSHRSSTVIRKNAVGDPFLGPIDNILVAPALRRRGYPSNV